MNETAKKIDKFFFSMVRRLWIFNMASTFSFFNFLLEIMLQELSLTFTVIRFEISSWLHCLNRTVDKTAQKLLISSIIMYSAKEEYVVLLGPDAARGLLMTNFLHRKISNLTL